MQLTYMGGTKTLSTNEEGTSTLAFDIGGAPYAQMAATIFDLLKQQNVPSHILAYNENTCTMQIVRCEQMPKLEWHWHCRLHDELYKRFKYLRPTIGAYLINPAMEIVTKQDRNLVSLTMVGGLGFLPGNQAHCFGLMSNSVVDILQGIFRQRGLDLWHVRLEWGVNPLDNTPMLVDAISPLECICSLNGSDQVLFDAEVADQFLNSSQQIQ